MCFILIVSISLLRLPICSLITTIYSFMFRIVHRINDSGFISQFQFWVVSGPISTGLPLLFPLTVDHNVLILGKSRNFLL